MSLAGNKKFHQYFIKLKTSCGYLAFSARSKGEFFFSIPPSSLFLTDELYFFFIWILHFLGKCLEMVGLIKLTHSTTGGFAFPSHHPLYYNFYAKEGLGELKHPSPTCTFGSKWKKSLMNRTCQKRSRSTTVMQ